MGKLIIDLDKELEEEFRKTVYESKGLRKGVIKTSFEEALSMWIKEQKQKNKEKSKKGVPL
jgi:hypothetical protein